MTTHDNEILTTRVGGFGGSDAAMFLKIGLKGLSALSESDKRRIAVALGQVDYIPVRQTIEMEAGHLFENAMANGELQRYEREKMLTGTSVQPKNFRIFAHADFSNESGHVVECKFSKSETVEVLNRYKAQLQWYYMLGAKKVTLLHGTGQANPFYQNGIEIDHVEQVDIDPQSEIINALLHGINLIDEFCTNFIYTEPDEWTEDDLLPFDRVDVKTMYRVLSEIKRLEAESEKVKARLLELMKENGIKSLKSEDYTITYIPESITTTFDKSKLFKEHPEINEADYTKQSKKKDYIKITLK